MITGASSRLRGARVTGSACGFVEDQYGAKRGGYRFAYARREEKLSADRKTHGRMVVQAREFWRSSNREAGASPAARELAGGVPLLRSA